MLIVFPYVCHMIWLWIYFMFIWFVCSWNIYR